MYVSQTQLGTAMETMESPIYAKWLWNYFIYSKLNTHRREHMITDLDEILSAGGKLSDNYLFFSLPLFHLHNHNLHIFI